MMKLIFKKFVVKILTWEARLLLKKYKPKIVAITGSVGKTSTKDAVFTVLSKHFFTRKSEKSFNSEIGVPLTILGLSNGWNNPFIWLHNVLRGFLICLPIPFLSSKPFPTWLVLEIGADRPGDIESVSKWLSPDIVIITRFGAVPVHVEFFKSQQEVIREKSFLVKALKDTGTLLLNEDDSDVRALRELKQTCRTCKIVSWSIDSPSDFKASNLDIIYDDRSGLSVPSGITFRVNYRGNSVPLRIAGTLGKQHVYPAVVALATGDSLGLNMISMAESLSEHKTPPGRMRLIEGVRKTTIIDDTYNASPVAMTEALRTLGTVKTSGCKIAVLGDMLELGKHSGNEHKRMGREAKEVCDILITVGIRARGIAEGALENGFDEKNIYQYDSSDEASKPVEELVKEGDIILVKGSQGIRMERVVEEVMAHPEDKEKLLVRQEPEWEKR